MKQFITDKEFFLVDFMSGILYEPVACATTKK